MSDERKQALQAYEAKVAKFKQAKEDEMYNNRDPIYAGRYSPSARKSRKCKKSSQFRSRKTGYCRKRKCGSGRTRDLVTGLCRKKKSRRSRSKSPTRKSRSRKSSKRKSPTRKSRSVSRKSSKRKSRSRKPPCPSGMILNRSNGRCRVRCVPGKSTRSRLTGRCRKINSPTRKSSKRKSRSRKSSTKSSPRKPKCTKPNQTRSRSTGRCRVPPCKPGMVRNKSTGKCRTKCLPGRIRGPSGRCIKRPKKSTSLFISTENDARGFEVNLSNEDLIKIWAATGAVPPTKSGFVPPPGPSKPGSSAENRGFASANVPAWSRTQTRSTDTSEDSNQKVATSTRAGSQDDSILWRSSSSRPASPGRELAKQWKPYLKRHIETQTDETDSDSLPGTPPLTRFVSTSSQSPVATMTSPGSAYYSTRHHRHRY